MNNKALSGVLSTWLVTPSGIADARYTRHMLSIEEAITTAGALMAGVARKGEVASLK
ncbi:hypothetical protein [Microbulbifer donghaiensis]|uniref:hypothetical protein n=1 Tax=Microbulbifer donghaiensis TaxID=494016 RepID=UPI00135630B2|nr:hypothetical protein [Microbulbifer donghaiensis]